MTSPSADKDQKENESWIVYDGECPFCTNYVHLLRLKDTIGNVRLINAREDTSEARMVRQEGYDLDEGMIFYYNNQFYHGADAIHMMALFSNSSRILNQINKFLFRSQSVSTFLYPWMRGVRNLTLKILRRRKISGEKF